LLRADGLAVQIRDSGSFRVWLDAAADRAVKRFSLPSPVFASYEVLCRAGAAWEKFRIDLGLPADAASYGRAVIEAKRTALAKRLLGRDDSQDVTFDEVRTKVPWPVRVAHFMKILLDPERTPDLHTVVHYHAKEALRSRKADCPGMALPEVDDVVLEFLDMLV
jgi:hypothetical protein